MSIAGTNAITEMWAKCKAYFQAKLVSGTNIKTINNESLLGSGNISVGGGGSDVTGVKGDSESTYRTGNVNLTAADIGAAAASHSHAISDVTDLQTTLNGKAPAANVHHSNSEMGLVTDNGLSRFIVTGNRNPRIDTRESTADNFATLGYLPLMDPGAAPNGSSMKAKNLVFATPNGSSGFPTMRKLVAADMTGLGDTAKGAAQSAIDSSTSNVSTTSGTTKNLDSIVLAPGTWLVTYSVEFASNATGRRAMTLTTNNTSISSTPVYMASGAPANGMATNLSRTQVIVNSGTSNVTRYLNAYQNSGSALNCRSCIQAVRIA